MLGYPSLPPRRAEWGDFRTVHAPQYLEQLATLAAGDRPRPAARLSAECLGLWHFLEGYRFGLGGMQEAIERMRRGELDRAYCFSLGGHHAFADRGHGYCLLNPLATAVRYAQAAGFARVLVIDWDVHHGAGTQAIFAHDRTVHCLSVHSALDLYMAKAGDWRQGMARGPAGRALQPSRAARGDAERPRPAARVRPRPPACELIHLPARPAGARPRTGLPPRIFLGTPGPR